MFPSQSQSRLVLLKAQRFRLSPSPKPKPKPKPNVIRTTVAERTTPVPKPKSKPAPAFKANFKGAAPSAMQARGGARINRGGGLLGLIKRKFGK
jgi:hypothetical protein